VSTFELALFASDLAVVAEAVPAGVASVVVDWENDGKEARQAFADTEVNNHTEEHLRAVRALTEARVLCRINAFGPGTAEEVDRAVEAGADEVLLPMVRTAAEVERTLALVDGRAGLGILVETRDAIAAADELARLPVSRVYVGLNDLSIDRGSATIFAPLADGTLDEVRERFEGVRFGFGGLTLPETGRPIPSRLLAGELARLRCDFTFLRRSFYRDVAGRDVADEVARIHAAVNGASARDEQAVARDRSELVERLAELGERHATLV
jgi:2-methylisocitrate lyase-like PEP mutase family enzyme